VGIQRWRQGRNGAVIRSGSAVVRRFRIGVELVCCSSHDGWEPLRRKGSRKQRLTTSQKGMSQLCPSRLEG